MSKKKISKKEYKELANELMDSLLESHERNKQLSNGYGSLVIEHATTLSELDKAKEEIKRLNIQGIRINVSNN